MKQLSQSLPHYHGFISGLGGEKDSSCESGYALFSL